MFVMGTSLKVHPFAGLLHRANADTVRVLINREVVGNEPANWIDLLSGFNQPFQFDTPENRRDVWYVRSTHSYECFLISSIIANQ